MKLFKKGAEAELRKVKHLGEKAISKKRVSKRYRDPKLDEKITVGRTSSEAKFLRKARKKVNTPRILEINPENKEIIIEQINGKTAKEKFSKSKTESAEKIGKAIKELHGLGIIHNDLTTSNVIISDGEPFFIDFGLAFTSDSVEDRATDLIVYEKMLKSTHFKNFEEIWRATKKGYSPGKEILERMKKIKKRVRYGGNS